MFFNKQEEEMMEKGKVLIEYELELYKRQKELIVDKDIQDRIHTNWETIDKARLENYKAQAIMKIETAELKAKLQIDTAKMEGKLEAMKEMAKKETIDIDWLRTVVLEAVKSLSTNKETNITNNNAQ